MKSYNDFGPRKTNPMTPQSEPVPGMAQVPNHAGGFGWNVDEITQLKRFLILGAASGTYYVGQRQVVKDNLSVIDGLIGARRGVEIVSVIREVSKDGRAISNDPALFVLARCLADPDVKVRRFAASVLSEVARTGTHLLHFVSYAKQWRGIGPLFRRAVASWYLSRPEQNLAYQLVKYQERDGYRQRDVIRLTHPKAETATYNAILHWSVKGWPDIGEHPHPDPALKIIWGFEKAKRTTKPEEIAGLIRSYRLTQEMVPSESLKSPVVWEALLETSPIEAVMRNLATMTRYAVLTPTGELTSRVCQMLTNREKIQGARLHPIKILEALYTYASGVSLRGKRSHTWTPIMSIIDALNTAFYLSFVSIEPTFKRILLAVDVSGSMRGTMCNGLPNMPLHTAAAAMALVLAKSEPSCEIIGVDSIVRKVMISPQQRLDDVAAHFSTLGGGGTNLALPMFYALMNKTVYDAIVILTDNETWQGQGHPVEYLARYRDLINPACKVINIQMASTRLTVTDQNDRRCLDVAGFDATVPRVIRGFLCDEF